MNPAVEEIKARLNLVDLVGGYVRLTKAGTNWKAPCPFHREKSPSFMVSEEKQIWHCFGCGKGGDAFGFVMEMESLDFKETLKMLAEKTGVQLAQYRSEAPEIQDNKKKILEILDLASRFYETQLWKGAGKTAILTYLKERGLKDETIQEFRLGYAPTGWRNLLDFMTGRKYDVKDVMAAGLLVQKEGTQDYYDRFRDRIIFPIPDAFGKVVGFTARVAPGQDESQAKYVNTPETSVYHKSQVLYGLDKAKQEIKKQDYTLVVEGNMDVIASHQAGLKNTVAVSGTALTAEQLATLKRYSDNVKLLFDMDAAGELAIRRSAELAFQKDLNVSIVRLSEGKDAAELANKDVNKLLEATKKSTPAMEYLIGGLLTKYNRHEAVDKKIIAKEAVAIIKEFGNEIEKSHWIKKLAEELEVEEKVLRDVLDKVKVNDYSPHPSPKAAEGKIEIGEKSLDREEIVRGEIVGLLLADSRLWKKTTENQEMVALFPEGTLAYLVVKNGVAAGFQMEKLFPLIQDEERNNLIQKLYFQTKFRVVQGAGVEEINLDDAEERLEKAIQELKKEYNKKRLKTILRDIKKAESAGDKDSLQILIGEFTKLSQDLK
jgi:DNA primase